ncbi:MAG TPA: sugar ABC transporter permease [Streptosporangiaceae bacterium]|nr:sugar ABC transporter permease [Streptosporangiaceae bacterium]
MTKVEVPSGGIAPARTRQPRKNSLMGQTSESRLGKTGFRAFLGALPFITPSFIGVIVFLVIPVIALFVISLLNWNLFSPATFEGFDNYLNIFRFDDARHSIGVTIYYVLLNIPLQTVVALGLAIMLNRRRPLMGIYRLLFVVPYLSTPVATAVIWYWVFDPKFGAVNTLLAHIGITGPQWLSSSSWAMPVVAMVNIWQYVGYNMLFFLAGLQAIPRQLYEAAEIDGAGPIKQFFRISLPLLNSTMLFVLVTGVIGSFQVFDTLYVLTQGGPGNSTEVMNLRIYQVAFTDFKLGEAAAMSVVLFGMILIFTIGQFLFFKNRTTYEYSA